MISLETGDNPGISGEMSSRDKQALGSSRMVGKIPESRVSKQIVEKKIFYLEGLAINL